MQRRGPWLGTWVLGRSPSAPSRPPSQRSARGRLPVTLPAGQTPALPPRPGLAAPPPPQGSSRAPGRWCGWRELAAGNTARGGSRGRGTASSQERPPPPPGQQGADPLHGRPAALMTDMWPLRGQAGWLQAQSR